MLILKSMKFTRTTYGTQSGFSVFDIVLALALVGVIGAAGYFAFQNYANKTAIGGAPSSSASPSPSPTMTSKITASWKTYTSDKGGFSLRYPLSWKQPTNPELCTPGLMDRSLYLGPDENSVLKCGSGFSGQMAVFSVDGDRRADYVLDKTDTARTSQSVAAGGVAGMREYGVVAADRMMGASKGTIETTYTFFSKGKTFVGTYLQAPSGTNPSKDVLGDFDLMIKSTLIIL